MEVKDKRLRDPVHGLIVFRATEPLDMLAWKIIDTYEFQRLQRIHQLGVSKFIFPSATHTRFAHSIGVFHTARKLVDIIRREIARLEQVFDEDRAKVAVIAALVHDIGHGPFSHTFETVQKSRNVEKDHEKWSAEIITDEKGSIKPLLDNFGKEQNIVNFCTQVADLIDSEDPTDIYHAVVSSSFDADRLDYLRRDRLMTGTKAGAIDFDWLIDNVRVAEIRVDAPEDKNGEVTKKVQTFCLDAKALPAAEQFLLARYTLHQQVYFHKATRGVELIIRNLLSAIATHATSNTAIVKQTGLPKSHPLIKFYAKDGDTVSNYLELDDALIFGSLNLMLNASDSRIRDAACRLKYRRLYKSLDLAQFGHDVGRQAMIRRQISAEFEKQIDQAVVFLDDKAAIGIYSQIGGDDERMHKKLHILDGQTPKEIIHLSKLVEALEPKKAFTRFYFSNVKDRDDMGRKWEDAKND